MGRTVILMDVCRGMVYLSSANPPFIHQDIKSYAIRTVKVQYFSEHPRLNSSNSLCTKSLFHFSLLTVVGMVGLEILGFAGNYLIQLKPGHCSQRKVLLCQKDIMETRSDNVVQNPMYTANHGD